MTISTDVLGLLRELDRMYEGAVMEPSEHRDEDFAVLAERLLAEYQPAARADRSVPRWVRRAGRISTKLRRYWEARLEEDRPAPEDWRSRVDEALGGRGWLPVLDLARWGLETDPDPELFEQVQERFRWTQMRPWMESVTYQEYLDARSRDPE